MKLVTTSVALAALTILSLSSAVLAQIAPDPKLRASHDTYHPVVDVLKAQRTPVTDDQLKQLKRFPLEAVWGTLQGLGYVNCHYSGLKSTRPQEALVGRALTIRYLPRRPDLDQAMETLAKEGDWPRAYNVRAAEEAKPGDVLVVDLGGGIPDGVFFGDISALGAKLAGAKGAVLYGSSRDLTELRAIEDFPVLAVGFDPRPALQVGVDWNVPIRVGSATVLPGDIVLADDEAVLFFPPQLAGQVIERTKESVAREDFEREVARLKQHRFRDVYPLNPELKEKFEAELKKRQK
jgi:4-hydroxy-4-methyl-2-oxoglutarate aldolase